VVLEIRDNGVGMDVVRPAAGVGLIGMQERVRLVGGTITIDSTPGSGVTLSIAFPRMDS
jgi:signal transduction histidine kinase